MNDIEVGQVLSLKIRYNNDGLLSSKKHPYLVIGIDKELNVVEIAQMDSLQGKEFKAARKSNKVIYNDNPTETVIDKDSYIQLDNRYRIENCQELLRFRRQTDKLSSDKLSDVLNSYYQYQREHDIDENKNVYIKKNELLNLNR